MPVILRKVSRASSSGAEQEGVVEEWTAEWDREQLLSLQVMIMIMIKYYTQLLNASLKRVILNPR